VVVDPFAGGGSTVDLCKKRYPMTGQRVGAKGSWFECIPLQTAHGLIFIQRASLFA
jgi:hypothetical protein